MKHIEKFWKKFEENKFTFLLIVFGSLVIASPFIQTEQGHFKTPVTFIFTAAIILVASVLTTNKKAFYGFTSLLLIIMIAQTLVRIYGAPHHHTAIIFTAWVIQLGFFCYFIIKVLMHLFETKEVTAETIKGGISAYILIGFMWALIYHTLHFIEPRSFGGLTGHIYDYFHLSYSTLSSVGYGDVVPLTSCAKMLTDVQGLIGQLFIATFIARLMGLHLAKVVGNR